MNINNLDLADLDFSNIGNWTLIPKVVVILFVCIILLVAGYFIDTSAQLQNIEDLKNKEADLKQLFEIKQAKAANLDSYKNQLSEIQKTFGSLLSQLPSKTEVADLLTDITQTGLTNGLEFELFRPQEERPKEFYAELPIEIKVRGQYHEFGKFMSSIASLPRIVTIQNYTIDRAPKEKNGKKRELILEANAYTYRYLDEKELEELKKLEELSGKKK
jgi:type IV pilus assembly protein PilO